MRAIIIGCGRVGARTATLLDERGDHVTVIDTDQRAFQRLPSSFGGVTVRGSGVDEDILRSAGAELADLLMSLTEGDNRNAMSAQLGKHVFGIPRVIAKINDPVRAEAYRTLGLETMCRTVLLADALVKAAAEGADATDGWVQPPTAEPLRGAQAPGTLPEPMRAGEEPPSAGEEPARAGAEPVPDDGAGAAASPDRSGAEG